MAVATWQKSTARRLVSVSAVREITNKMLFGLTPAVTSEAGTIPLVADQTGGQRCHHVGLTRLARGAADDAATGTKHEHRGRARDAQPARQVEPLRGVDLDVGHALDHARDPGQHLPGRAAWRAEGGRELDQRGPLAKTAAEIGLGKHVRGAPDPGLHRPGPRDPEAPRAAAQRKAEYGRQHESRG